MLVDLLTPEYISQCLWFSNAAAAPDASFREEDFNTLLLNPKELNTTFREFSMGQVEAGTAAVETVSNWSSYFIEQAPATTVDDVAKEPHQRGATQRKVGLAAYGKRQGAKNKQLIDRKIE